MNGTREQVGIRWLIRRDMPQVLAIENAVVDSPWDEYDVLHYLKQRNNIGIIAETQPQCEVVAFMFYSLEGPQIRVLRFAVAPGYQRRGIGTRMVDRLKDKLVRQVGRKELVIEVRESLLGFQYFLSAQGFRASHVIRDHFFGPDEDAYLFRFSLDDEWRPTYENRIAGLFQ